MLHRFVKVRQEEVADLFWLALQVVAGVGAQGVLLERTQEQHVQQVAEPDQGFALGSSEALLQSLRPDLDPKVDEAPRSPDHRCRRPPGGFDGFQS
jgi:hypothetical protein